MLLSPGVAVIMVACLDMPESAALLPFFLDTILLTLILEPAAVKPLEVSSLEKSDKHLLIRD